MGNLSIKQLDFEVRKLGKSPEFLMLHYATYDTIKISLSTAIKKKDNIYANPSN